jgi:Uma2 family endonuclease
METPTLLTADEFFHHPAAQDASELVRGEIRMMTPAGGRHNVVAGRLFTRLSAFVEERGLGMTFTDNLGYSLPIPGETRDTVRAPDASFVRIEQLPDGEIPLGFLRCAPDLAVEVLSPEDRPGELAARMRDYFAAGTRCVWVVDPDARTVTVHAPHEPTRRIAPHEDLDGDPVLPGFQLSIAALFVGLRANG